MAVHKAKRVIDYTMETIIRLSDLRMIVAETQGMNAESVVEFPRFGATEQSEYLHIVITEDGPVNGD